MKDVKNKIVIPLLAMGIIIQAWHFYKIAGIISGLGNLYCLFISVFLSSGLLYWTIKVSNQELKIERKLKWDEWKSELERFNKNKFKIIIIFFRFELFSNFYFWLYVKVFDNIEVVGNNDFVTINWEKIDYYSLPVIMVFSYMIPFILRSYAGELIVDKKHTHDE